MNIMLLFLHRLVELFISNSHIIQPVFQKSPMLFHVYATTYMVPYLTNVIGQLIGYATPISTPSTQRNNPPIPCIFHTATMFGVQTNHPPPLDPS